MIADSVPLDKIPSHEIEELYMEPETAWWFDNQRMPAVFNDSDTDRISMFADTRPFGGTHQLTAQR
jgi:hypothetical protein